MTKKGFTLMELMVVVLLIAILAAIAIPFYNDAIDSQNNAKAKAILETLNGGLERLNREYRIFIPSGTGADRENNDFRNVNNTTCYYNGQQIGNGTNNISLQNFIGQLIACGYVPKSVNYNDSDYVFRLQSKDNPVCGQGYVYMEPRPDSNGKVSVGSKYCLETTQEIEGQSSTVCIYCAGMNAYTGKAMDLQLAGL